MDHIGRRLATAPVLMAMAVLALPIAARAQALPPVAAEEAPSEGGFSQRGVIGEATAEDAVAARELGLVAAQRAAWARLAAEMGLRPATDRQVEAMVDSVVVEQERTTRTTYTGRMTVNFNPGRVQAFAGRAAPAPSQRPAAGPQSAAAYLDVTARFGSLAEWLDVRRRLLAAASVSQVDVLAISTDQARLRLGLRAPAAQAAAELMPAGIRLAQGVRPGEGWRVGLAGRI